MIRDAEDLHRVRKLNLAVLSERVLKVSNAMGMLIADDLAFLPQSAGDERDPGTLGRVLSHGRARTDGLVVWMGMDEEKAAVCINRSHDVSLVRA